MRKKLIAANWKMNITPSEAVQLVEKLRPLVQNPEVDVVYCVPAIDLVPVAEAIAGSNVLLGAENMSAEEKGAYTGEISAAMLKDVGAQYVILGHSERRGYFHETSAEVGAKVRQAIRHGLTPILCCGESLEQREQGIILDFIRQQLKISFYGIPAEAAAGVVIAYEPIWAIGTGITATSSQAEEVCAGIRACMEDIYDRETAEAIRILYGGSVNEDNAENLFAQPDIDGGLVGGASLREEFGKIVNYRIL